MTDREKFDVLSKLDYEGGFDYLISGSNFSEHKDPEFRKLVNAYISSSNALSVFLGDLEDYEFEDED